MLVIIVVVKIGVENKIRSNVFLKNCNCCNCILVYLNNILKQQQQQQKNAKMKKKIILNVTFVVFINFFIIIYRSIVQHNFENTILPILPLILAQHSPYKLYERFQLSGKRRRSTIGGTKRNQELDTSFFCCCCNFCCCWNFLFEFKIGRWEKKIFF